MINKKKLESYPREDLGLGRRQILTNNHTHRATYMTYDRGKWMNYFIKDLKLNHTIY
jgi:hypothetical protein